MDRRIYPWGDAPAGDQLCWQGRAGAREALTCAVGSFPQGASPYGVLDMAGNVAEWTSSENPEAGGPGSFYARGGGFPLTYLERADPEYFRVRSDIRLSFGGDDAFRDVGFRCARDR